MKPAMPEAEKWDGVEGKIQYLEKWCRYKQNLYTLGRSFCCGLFLSNVAVKPPTSGGGYKATYTVVSST
jgi:hypothetical protein